MTEKSRLWHSFTGSTGRFCHAGGITVPLLRYLTGMPGAIAHPYAGLCTSRPVSEIIRYGEGRIPAGIHSEGCPRHCPGASLASPGCARTIYRYAHIIYYTSQATHPAQGQGTAAALSRARGQNRVFSLILPICHTQRTASLSSRMRISASLPRVSAPLRSCTPMMWAGVSLAMRMASSRGTSA